VIFAHAGFSKVSGNLQAVAIGATNLLFTMIAMSVIDRLGRKDAAAGRFGRDRRVPWLESSIIFFTGQHQNLLVWLASRSTSHFSAFLRGRHLAYLSEVSPILFEPRARVWEASRAVHERSHFSHLPADGRFFGRLSLRVFRRDDGGAVLRCAIRLSGNQAPVVGRNAKEARDQLGALLAPSSSMFLSAAFFATFAAFFASFAVQDF
jgi:hypothetical protein